MAIIRYIVVLIAFSTIFTSFGIGQSSDLGTVCAESREYYGVEGYPNSEFIWALSGGVISSGDGQDTIEVIWGYNVGNFTIEVVEVSQAGCQGVPSMGTINISAPLVDLGVNFLELCDKDSIVLDARGDYIQPYLMQWHDGNYAPSYTAKETELIWVKVTDGMGCVRYDTIDLVVHPLPLVNLGNDTILCDEMNPLALDAGNNTFYSWTSFEAGWEEVYNGNPYFLYPSKALIDTIEVVVTDEHGCTMNDTLVLYPCDVASLFKGMPNTFTPNDDSQNETWVIPHMENFPKAVLEIFDRWGRLVYRTEHVFDEPWDGKSKGRPMPMDTYYFVLELNYMHIEPITGNINIIK
ncbi:MAG: gliding motility-associated C-terminal domain-containing protein [Bacteroidales bacterium]|nr:gliding motility-associated C-terminal domain-containing protein [Bacteroidales bacterium]MBN2818388.1 gliding motility-associated C-terminal domain-containing protein [Bacteroidales bacterium]